MISSKVRFIYKWQGDRATCWSGTPLGLFKGLSKHIEVLDCPIEFSVYDNIRRQAQRGYNHITRTNDFNILATQQGQRIIEKMYKFQAEKAIPNLMFCEYNTSLTEHSYVYQDLSVDFIVRWRQYHPNIGEYSSIISGTTQSIIQKRAEMTDKFYRNCKGVFTMSEWLRKDMILNSNIPANKIHCVGGGCNLDIKKVNYGRKNGNRFLFVGKDWERKNGPLVLESFLKLRDKYPEIELYIAGPENIELIKGNRPGVHFLGYKSYNQLIEYYNLCDFFIMPSLFEAYGIVFAEALIFGLPCIGRNDFAMPEFITSNENGYLIETNKIEELCKAMENLLLNRDRLVSNYK